MRLISTERKRKLRRILEGRFQIISAEDAKAVRFYQFKPSTAEFFYRLLGRTDVTIQDTPHFRLADAMARDSNLTEAEGYYIAYLTASWGREKSDQFGARLNDFKSHFSAFRSNVRMPSPSLSYFSEAAPAFSLDGNHRLSFAAALGRQIKCRVLPPDLAILIYSSAKEFYGTGYREMPYQSIYVNGAVIVEGRRNDALDRIRMIPPQVIERKTILDVASNIGMSSLLAKTAGAVSCCGLEISAGMVDLATRFSMFEGAYPSVTFRRFNIDEGDLPSQMVYDTAFMFSIHDHLKKPDRLLTIAQRNVKEHVVFEGHPGSQRERYAKFFDSGIFESVQELGVLSESRFSQAPIRSRPVWLCKKA